MRIHPIVWLLLGAAVSLAQDQSPKLINLGRLSIARVHESGVNTENQFYGPRNLFDGGTHVINGIHYSYWIPNSPASMVIVRFARAVTVAGIVMELGDLEPTDPGPEGFSVQMRAEQPPGLIVSPFIPTAGARTMYVPPQPIEGVRDVTLLFTGRAKSPMRVDEIEIMGPPPSGADLSPMIPGLDTELMKQASEQPEAGKDRNMAFIRTLAEIQVDGMRAMRAAIDRDTDSARKAQGWLRLNAAADRLAVILDNQVDLKPLALKAAALGVSLDVCEPSRLWDAGTQGYERYLQLFPDGPQADEAWWKGRLSNGPRCGDNEGSPEEYRELIEKYSEFVKRFPHSEYVPRARQRLDEYRKELQTGSGAKAAK